MDLGERSTRITDESAPVKIWRGEGAVPEVRCAVEVLVEIGELAMSGYSRYPWGGVEVGGVLFGKREPGALHISHWREAECEHHYGPAFDLSKEDYVAFERLLAHAAADAELAGLAPVGWFQSVSRRDLGLSEKSSALFHRFFSHPWQVSMVVKRSKKDPLSIGMFVRDSRGRIEPHSPFQEFTLDSLRHRQLPVAAPKTSPQPQDTVRAALTEEPQSEPTLHTPAEIQPDVSAQHDATLIDATLIKAVPAPDEVAEDPPDAATQHDSAAPIAAVPPPHDAAEPPPDLPAQHGSSAPIATVSAPPDAPFSFFGLTSDPFSAHPNAQFFYPSPQHREALGVLFHQTRSRAGFLALAGEPGTGKSIVLECLTNMLTAHGAHFALLLNSKVTVTELFELIAHDLRLPCATATKSATVIALNNYLLERSQAGLLTALVIDNAEKLSTAVLEEIELLGNLENRDGRLLQVIFAAQPGFERRLDVPELRGLKQRLMLWARLEPFDAAQTAAYVEHRLAKAGGRTPDIFPADALLEIYRRTGGVPRLINALCSRLLKNGRELQVKTVHGEMVQRIADDFGLNASTESLEPPT